MSVLLLFYLSASVCLSSSPLSLSLSVSLSLSLSLSRFLLLYSLSLFLFVTFHFLLDLHSIVFGRDQISLHGRPRQIRRIYSRTFPRYKLRGPPLIDVAATQCANIVAPSLISLNNFKIYCNNLKIIILRYFYNFTDINI